jgi:aspartate kinase
MSIIVKKFGGNRVVTDKDRENIQNLVRCDLDSGHQPVLVVSAMGRKGKPYATDTLLNLYHSVNPKGDKRDIDLLISCGEIISATLVSACLNKSGIPSIALTGFQAGIITDNNFGDASVLKVETSYLENVLSKGIVPVISGFQGISLEGEITTLGRGGSDTTATLIGEALRAERVEIITDVQGVMTADPKIVSEASVIAVMSYEELYEMARQGAKVVDFNAVDIAKRADLNLVVRDVLVKCKGTIVAGESKNEKFLTAVTQSDDWIQYMIEDPTDSLSNQSFMDALHNEGISIDMINFFIDKKYFTIKSNDEAKLDQVVKGFGLKSLKRKGCAKVTIIGHKIHGVPGVMRRIVKALENEGIKILQTSDSHMTISCLVDCNESDHAVVSLHREFKMNN